MNEFEDALASGGVPILGGDASASEEAEEEEDDNDITNNDNIRQSHTVVTTRDTALPDNTNLPRTRLTFSIEAPVARNALGLAEDPRPRPLDRYEQFDTETNQPAGSSELGNAAGIAAADLLRASLGLMEEGSTLHGTIRHKNSCFRRCWTPLLMLFVLLLPLLISTAPWVSYAF